MPRLEYVDEPSRRSIINFPCLEFQTSPWTPFNKKLSQCKVAIISSAALHLRGDDPFHAVMRAEGDASFRVIPSSTRANDLIQSHVSIGFDRTGLYRDINIAFPVDRLRELVERGAIGSLARDLYSFHGGAHRNPRPLMRQMAPELAQRLKAEGVDVVLFVPI